MSSDLNAQASQADRTLRDLLQAQFSRRTNGAAPFASDGSTPCSGFINDGFKVVPQSPLAMGINLTAGYGFEYTLLDSVADIGGALNLNDLSTYKPLFLSGNESITVPTADPTDPRIDIVEVTYDRRATDNSSRDVLDIGTGEFVATLVDKTLAWIQDGRTSVGGAQKINYKVGTPGAVPVAPSVTAGYTKIAEIRVEAASVTVPQNKIKDMRAVIGRHGINEINARVLLPGTTAGAVAATMQSFSGPPGSGMALYPTPASAGGNYTFFFWCGGAMKDLVLHLYGEHGGPTDSILQPINEAALTGGDITLITGGTGVIAGPTPTEGQIAANGVTRQFQRATPAAIQADATYVNFTLKFRSY